MESKRRHYELPEVDGEFLARLVFDGASLTLELTTAARPPRRIDIVFRKVRAFRHYAEAHVTPFHVEGAFDVLTEVENSLWADEIRQRTRSPWDTYWVLRHYLLYVDSAGSFEILADGYSVEEISEPLTQS